MAKRTYTTDETVVDVSLTSTSITVDDSISIKGIDKKSDTVVANKVIPVSDILSQESSNITVETVNDNFENPYTLNFKETEDGSLKPSNSITYRIFTRVKLRGRDTRKVLIAQFTVYGEIKEDGFRYHYEIDKTNKVSLSFNRKEGNLYETGDDLTFTAISDEHNLQLSKTISVSFSPSDTNKDESGTAKVNIGKVQDAVKNSIDDNLSIDSSDVTGESVSLVNEKITESERFLKYGIINEEGDSLLVTNWVNGGILNQIDDEIEPLGSIVLKLYDDASPLSVKDEVIFTELYANDIELTVDLGEDVDEEGPLRLTPNFRKEVEENTISTFSEYQSFDELTLSGSSVQEKVIDHFLQKKQESVGLNVDFTNFNNFVKFSSAEERLVNFRYKVRELETYASQSASLSNSSVTGSFVDNKLSDIEENVREIKNGFDEYEQFLFNDSGSLYVDEPFVSESDNVYASWPKNSPSELLNNGDFSDTSSWSTSSNAATIGNGSARIFKNGEISQSLSLTGDEEYVLTFDVIDGGLPVSFNYNGKNIVNETLLTSGSNEFRFSTRNLNNSDDVLSIVGADYGNDSKFTEIDNISVKRTPQLLSSNSSQVQNWYEDIIHIARDYDGRNKDSLRNNTPSYIRDDDRNEDYILFLDMIGQMFDEIWLYGKELGNLYAWDNDISKGVSEDLSIVLLEAYGNNLDIGFSEKDIWEYVLGVDRKEDSISNKAGFSFEKRQKETIRRLLVNLPYLLKHKGTARSVEGLVLSYGIPLSTLFIREYGTFQGTDGLESIFTKEKQTEKLNLNGSGKSLSLNDSTLVGSNAVEFNLQISNKTSATMSLFESSGSGDVNISVREDASVSDYGFIALSINDGTNTFELKSDSGPIYNGGFWNVVVQRVDSGSYEVRSYQFNRNDGTYDYQLVGTGSTGSSISSSIDNTFSDGDYVKFNNFDGYLDEWRIWDQSFSESVFKEHVKFPTSIKLEDPLQIPDSLLLRADIETSDAKYIADDKNRLPNLVFDPQLPTQITASGFSTSDFTSYTRVDYINSTNVGNEKLGNNKVRFDVTQSLSGDVLTPNFDDAKRDNEYVGSVDDSYKLTVGFSPTDITNEIILQHFGGKDLLDEFGDPTERYDEKYTQLEQTVESFFENVSINKKAKFFIEYIRNFDKTLFENIEKFVPERSDLSTSIFIEPHYLDRSKSKRLGKSETENLFKDGRDIEQPFVVDSSPNTSDNTEEPLVVTDDESFVGDMLSDSETNDANAVISQDEIPKYLNQSTNVVILKDGFESKTLRNNIWEEDSSITVINKYGETFRFKVYKFGFKEELNELESKIGNYLSNNESEDKEYEDLTRLHDRYSSLDNKLFLLDYDANPIPNSELVTYEDLPESLKDDLRFGEGTTSTNRTVTKNGVTYIVSDDTVDGGSVVEYKRTTDTRTIASDPQGDIKLTVE